jgi:hypothetical protein
MSKEEWVNAFVKALELRHSKQVSPRIARTIAMDQWLQLCSIAPDVAARRWAAQAKR